MATLALLLHGCTDTYSLSIVPLRPTVDVDASDAAVDATAVFAQLDRYLADVQSHTNVPATDADIKAAERDLPCAIPPLMRQMYLWHDGASHLLPYYEWLSLHDLVQEYQSLRKLERDIGVPKGEVMPVHFLPMLRFDGQEHISVDCSATDRSPLYHTFMQDDARDPVYRGPGHLLAVTLKAYETGAYRRRRGYPDVNRIGEMKAFRALATPGEIDAMEANWKGLERELRTARGGSFPLIASYVEHIPDPRAIPILVTRLRDDDQQVVTSAAFALGALKAQDALAELTLLLTHDSADVRNMAASALSDLDSIESDVTIGRLIELLRDPNDLVVVSAIEALGAAKARVAVDPLVELLSTSRPGIQQYIVITLADIGDRNVLPTLRTLKSNLATQDLGLPDRGGTRASDPPPKRLLATVEDAISKLGG